MNEKWIFEEVCSGSFCQQKAVRSNEGISIRSEFYKKGDDKAKQRARKWIDCERFERRLTGTL